jgi:formylglycine-generating enzyme required for sulfatase activity
MAASPNEQSPPTTPERESQFFCPHCGLEGPIERLEANRRQHCTRCGFEFIPPDELCAHTAGSPAKGELQAASDEVRVGGPEGDPADAPRPQHAFPDGVKNLIAEADKLSNVAAEIQEALRTLTPNHPDVVSLCNHQEAEGARLRAAIEAKAQELRATDERLAEWYRPNHQDRRDIAQQLEALTDTLARGCWAVVRHRLDTVTLDLGKDVTMELLLVPAGEFMMGADQPAEEVARLANSEPRWYRNEHPQHCVRITEDFYMGRYQVTEAQWEAVMGDVRSGRDLPVVDVSWADAETFCRRLSLLVRRQIRLPTEAEWEYACRAGTTTPYCFGKTISTDQANYDGNHIYGDGAKGVSRGKTLPVGSFAPNAWGLHDMHGNVWEWCRDCFAEYSGGIQDDPCQRFDGIRRVLRGGSWFSNPDSCRSANRRGANPGSRNAYFGFRVAAATPRINSPEFLARPVTDLEFSVRTRRALRREGIETIGDLLKRSEQELLSPSWFGAGSLREVQSRLGELGLALRNTAISREDRDQDGP